LIGVLWSVTGGNFIVSSRCVHIIALKEELAGDIMF
jgi:hypothetical protein